MPFQPASGVLLQQAAGFPGELAYDGPKRVFPWTLVSTPNPNVVGATAFTVVSAGVATAGGAGVFAGILVDPKAYALYGQITNNGALLPSMTLPDETIGELATMGIFFVVLSTAAAIGDKLSYVTATGALNSYASGGAPAGGSTAIPNATVILLPSAAAGLAVIELTN